MEEANKDFQNTLYTISYLLDNDPENTQILLLQDNISFFNKREYYLTDKIGIGCFIFDSHSPYSSGGKNRR